MSMKICSVANSWERDSRWGRGVWTESPLSTHCTSKCSVSERYLEGLSRRNMQRQWRRWQLPGKIRGMSRPARAELMFQTQSFSIQLRCRMVFHSPIASLAAASLAADKCYLPNLMCREYSCQSSAKGDEHAS